MASVNRPIIPSEIVVHLGAPDEQARNITVPFIEYIKNVASSEVYPSWPTDAIKANVLSEISFALNRIYNEWYPSKGYNFDITSSPKYDQAFIEDRNIYESISKIVDDIFNNYIIRDGQIQPFFAQYCDGKTTTCDGLSQWGSVTLANKGKDPKEILDYYYGDDISIVYDAPVKEKVESYPGYPLKVGNSGDMVLTIKKQLNRIRKNYPSIPLLNETEFYDYDLENAVKKFQNIFNLDETGIVDKATWYKIKYIYNSVKKIADLYSEGISLSEATKQYENELKLGDEGPFIKVLQYYLNAISYFDEDIESLPLESVFNKNMEEMVKSFQTKYKLKPTGIVDKQTWIKLKEVYNDILETIKSEDLYPGYFLLKGTSNDDVKTLQNFLYIICEKTHSIPGVRVNGTFDDLTEKSIKKIQSDNNLPVNGVVGPATWYQIVEMSKK